MPDGPADIMSPDIPSRAYGSAPDAAASHIARERRQMDPGYDLTEADLMEADPDDVLGPHAKAHAEGRAGEDWGLDEFPAEWEETADRGTADHDLPIVGDDASVSKVEDLGTPSQSSGNVLGFGATYRPDDRSDVGGNRNDHHGPGHSSSDTHHTKKHKR